MAVRTTPIGPSNDADVPIPLSPPPPLDPASVVTTRVDMTILRIRWDCTSAKRTNNPEEAIANPVGVFRVAIVPMPLAEPAFPLPHRVVIVAVDITICLMR